MKIAIYILTLFLSVTNVIEAQFLEKVKLNFKYNTDQCNFTCNLLIIDGSATSTLARKQASSLISLDIPSSASLAIVQEHNPIMGDPLNGGTVPISWDQITDNTITDLPYDRKVINITPNIGQDGRYENLYPGDTVRLFDFSLNYNFISDSLNIYNAGFTVGSFVQLYDVSTFDNFPVVFADITVLDSIGIGETTMLTPTSDGAWSTNADTIASIDNNGIVTGVGDGFAILTYTPDNGDCPTSVIVKVGDTYTGDDPINPQDPPPSPSGDPSVAAFIDGNGAQGIIIPRISVAQRLAIVNPALGLLVFQYDEYSGFYYFDQGVWKKL